MENKKISVVMATYNCAGTIENALKSIVKQKYDNIEIIISDGGSTDGTVEIINKYKEYIAYFVSEKDEGIYDALNKSMFQAKGEIIVALDGDNWFLNENVFSYAAEKLADGYDIYAAGLVQENPSGYKLALPDCDLEKLYYSLEIFNPATIIKREVIERNGVYDKKYRCAGDHEFLLRMHNAKERFFIDDRLTLFFAHGGVSNDPRKVGYKEDREISIRYGIPKLKANLVYYKRMLRFTMIVLLRKIGLYNWAKKIIMGSADLSYDELCKKGIDVKNYWFDTDEKEDK